MARRRATNQKTNPVPDWFTETIGNAKRARELYVRLHTRWNLVSYNANPNLRFQQQIDWMRATLFGDYTDMWWWAGNRGGKSEGGVVPFVALATGIRPFCVGGNGIEDRVGNPEPVQLWISSLDFASSRDIIREKLDRYIPEECLDGPFVKTDQIYYFRNGSTIGLKSADSGFNKYMGTSRTGILLDEEHPKPIYDECAMRVMDQGGFVQATLTPVNGITWSYDEIFCKRDELPDFYYQHTTSDDNPYLPPDAVEKRMAKLSEKQKRVRRLGMYEFMSGSNVFPIDQVGAYREQCIPPERKEEAFGLEVWADPEPGRTYVIGADVGKGKDDGDYSAAVVYDPLARCVVAMIRDRVDAGSFGYRLSEIGERYNTATLVVERNDHGVVTLERLRSIQYPKIWRRRRLAKMYQNKLDEYGYHTDGVGKPLLIESIYAVVDDMSIQLPSATLVDELSTYVHFDDKLPKRDTHKIVGKVGAMAGRYDDTVIALGLALVGARDIRIESLQQSVEAPDYITAMWKHRGARRKGPARVTMDYKYFGNARMNLRGRRR